MKLVHDADIITPVGDRVSILRRHSLAFDNGRIVELGPAESFLERIAAGRFEVLRGEKRLVVPGLVNTHHHLYQILTRCHPCVQNERLFNWLTKLYPYWRGLDYRAVNLAAKIGIAELLLHGCTTTSDHFYMFPAGSDVAVEAVLDAAEELGVRLHLARGCMTLGQARGGLPPDDCVETDAAALEDCRRVLERYHDPSEYSMRRIDLAPCSPFNCTLDILRESIALARSRKNVLLHTHLAETLDEQRYCVERYGCRPARLLADLGFLGPDVYLAHCVHLRDDEIDLFAETGTGVSHNPSSNMRLGSGIAPLRKLLAARVRVGLAVDGSSSNDGGNLLGEARLALLGARALQAKELDAVQDPEATGRPVTEIDSLFPAAEAFKLATIGGAACLNRPVLGHLNPGAAADFAMFRTDDAALAGAVAHDPLAALILCAAPRAENVYVAGKEVVRDGRITALNENELAERMNALVAARFRSERMPNV